MTTPQNNVKSVSVLDLEDFVINLEQAENLLNVYLEFIDDECPAIENKDTKKESLAAAAVVYASRTDMFQAVLRACFDIIKQSKTELSKLIYPPQTASTPKDKPRACPFFTLGITRICHILRICEKYKQCGGECTAIGFQGAFPRIAAKQAPQRSSLLDTLHYPLQAVLSRNHIL